mmetsp:Transcript_92538/g.188399  ORF Transcript_92538/g.188399 Transcript_92538/m.188399 type:complete len:162 (-) Transcript_92538:2978-3463(-)
MLLYLTIVFLFFYTTNAHGIIMDFTLNTIMGDRDGHDYATMVMRSCLFVTRANTKGLSLGWSFHNNNKCGTQMGGCQGQESQNRHRGNNSNNNNEHENEVCVVSFQKKASKKRGNKVLGSGLFSFLDHHHHKRYNRSSSSNKNRRNKTTFLPFLWSQLARK